MVDHAAFRDLIAEIRTAFFALRATTGAMLADLDCTAPERSLLEELATEDPRSVPALARTRSISRQAMQKVVDRLVKRRWVAAIANPGHARSPLIQLAPAGARVLAEIRRREAAALAAFPAFASASELRRASRTLASLSRALAARTKGRR